MTAEQSLREGRPREALELLQARIRKDASDPKPRIFLFQLLAVLGRWERAMTQLDVLADLDPGSLAMVHAYRAAIQCERLRADVFAGRRGPLVFGEPPEWIALALEALKFTAEGKHAQARPLRERVLDLADAVSGKVDGAPVAWIADADTRIGPVLEAIVDGKYYWVPFERVRTIRMEAPSDLRDFVWTAAQFRWANGGESFGLVPTRYPGSEQDDDAAVVLARKTEWTEPDEGVWIGRGQRMLASDVGEHPLLDVRLVELETATPDSGAGA